MLVYKMRYLFFTLKCVPTEVNIFEDALGVLLPFLFNHKKYAYVVEKDNTPDRHLHFILEGKYKDLNAFKTKLKTKPFRAYLDLINRGFISSNNYSIDTQLVPLDSQDDVLALLGYIYKEDAPTRRDNIGFSEEEICIAIKSYWSEKRLLAKQPTKHQDVKIITIKNAHAWIRDFVDKNPEYQKYINENWRVLSLAMRQHYYSFADMSKPKLREVIEDIRIQDGYLNKIEQIYTTEDLEGEKIFYGEKINPNYNEDQAWTSKTYQCNHMDHMPQANPDCFKFASDSED